MRRSVPFVIVVIGSLFVDCSSATCGTAPATFPTDISPTVITAKQDEGGTEGLYTTYKFWFSGGCSPGSPDSATFPDLTPCASPGYIQRYDATTGACLDSYNRIDQFWVSTTFGYYEAKFIGTQNSGKDMMKVHLSWCEEHQEKNFSAVHHSSGENVLYFHPAGGSSDIEYTLDLEASGCGSGSYGLGGISSKCDSDLVQCWYFGFIIGGGLVGFGIIVACGCFSCFYFAQRRKRKQRDDGPTTVVSEAQRLLKANAAQPPDPSTVDNGFPPTGTVYGSSPIYHHHPPPHPPVYYAQPPHPGTFAAAATQPSVPSTSVSTTQNSSVGPDTEPVLRTAQASINPADPNRIIQEPQQTSPTSTINSSIGGDRRSGMRSAPSAKTNQQAAVGSNNNTTVEEKEAADRFTVMYDHQLGEGGYGSVYKGYDEAKGVYVAIKQSPLEPGATAALRAEFDMLKSLRHDNIVSVLAMIPRPEEGVTEVVLEWMSSGSVHSVMGNQCYRLHEGVIRRYAKDALQGLVYLHDKKVLHRDIKPANMLLSAEGTVKLSDFGTSKYTTSAAGGQTLGVSQQQQRNSKQKQKTLKMHKTATLVGTSPYMSWEAISNQEYSEASDMWAFGCSLVEMATGDMPWCDLPPEKQSQVPMMFHIASSAEPNHHPTIPEETLSPQLVDLIKKCFKRDPKERIRARALLDDPYFSEEATGVNSLPEGIEALTNYKELRDAAYAAAADEEAEEIIHDHGDTLGLGATGATNIQDSLLDGLIDDVAEGGVGGAAPQPSQE